jgi:hypothetical protein
MADLDALKVALLLVAVYHLVGLLLLVDLRAGGKRGAWSAGVVFVSFCFAGRSGVRM